MIENDYIAKRRTATKRLNAEIRAMPEFAEAMFEVMPYSRAFKCGALKEKRINEKEWRLALAEIKKGL